MLTHHKRSQSQKYERNILILPTWRRSSAYSVGQLQELVTAQVKKEAFDAFGFGTDVVTLIRSKSSRRSADLSSVEGLRLAYDKAIEREGRLNHALSRTQMEWKENQTLFRETVELAEVLKEENRSLSEKLENELNLVFYLRQQLKLMTSNSVVLEEELDDMRTMMDNTARERAELSESNVLAMAKITKQEELINRIKDQQTLEKNSWDVNIQETINELVSELERERESRKQIECRLLDAQTRLEDAQTRLEESQSVIKQLKKTNEDLMTKFEENSNRLEEEIVRICKEKTLKELNYEKLIQDYTTQEVEPDTTSEKISIHNHFPTAADEDDLKVSSLAEQIYSKSGSRSLSIRSELSCLEGGGDNNDEEKANQKETYDKDPAKADVFQTYLYITATAVKLHFPDLEVIEVESLIEYVNSSPFYLWYDLMTTFMREFKQKAAIEELKNADKLPESHKEQRSLLARFKRLRQGGRESSKNEIRAPQADKQLEWRNRPRLRGRATSIVI